MGTNSQRTVFVREATGLVREIGPWPSFLAVWFLVTGGVPILILEYFSSWPGANFPVIFAIALLPSLALASLYTIFSISMPRSGGDYVFVSRGLNPFLGFVNSFSLAAAFLISNGIYAAFASSYISYQLYAQGIVDNNANLQSLASVVSSPVVSFGIALAFLLIAFGIAVLRTRNAWRVIFLAGIIALVSTLISFIVLATINPTTFQTSYNSFITANNATLTSAGYGNLTNYSDTITAGGGVPAGGLLASLAAFPLAWYSYTWYTLPSVWAGEVKQARRSMPITIVGAVLFIGAYFILFLVLTIHAFGQPFLTAWSSLAYTSGYPLPATVNLYIPFFSYLVYHNSILMWIMFIALWLPDVMAFPPLIIATTRYLFSWSFDRLLPELVARVSMRTNTPIIASLIALIVSIFGAAIQVFAPSATPGVIVPIFTFGYILPAITGIVFPYLRKGMYESAFMYKRKVAGLPTITWLGIISLISLIIGTYALFGPFDYGGFASFKLVDYLFYALAYGIGIVIFLVAWGIRKRQGVQISLAFSEIPPE